MEETMKLDRAKAVGFARTHWNTVSDDGVFWLTGEAVNVERKRRELGAPLAAGWQFRFVPDGAGGEKAVFQNPPQPEKLVQGWDGLADCAHFLSRCLHAGGLPVSSLSVPELVRLLQTRADTRTLAERVSRAQGQNIVNSSVLKEGDFIGYFNISPHGDFGGARQYSHSTMYVGKIAVGGGAALGRVTCHTKSRFGGLTPPVINDEWHLDSDHYQYTFIHFSDDDITRSSINNEDLVGWWRISGASPIFQYNDDRGRAYFTFQEPMSANAHLGAQETAYWFLQGTTPDIVFTWRKTGTVDVWQRAIAAGVGYDVTTNGVPGRSATRIFP
jgi:hypothetical protein